MIEKNRLETGDYLVLVGYFVIVITTGIVSSLKNRGSVGGYFLAGQNTGWWLVGLSLFASNIGSGHFIGLAGTAAGTGIAIAAFELHAVITLSMLGWLFVPVYRATGVFTLPEYLSKRFGGVRIRMYLAGLSLLLYVTTKIAADLYSGAVFLNEAIPGVGMYFSVFLLIITAALFTITGGLTAVIWTDAVQTVIMILGAFVLMIMSFKEVGGYGRIEEEFPMALPDKLKANLNNESYQFHDCSVVTPYYFKIMRPADLHGGDLPWTGLIFGLTVSAIWYWCTDQVIVQRALAAKNMVHAKAACIMASYLKILPLYLIVFPGMISRILYPNEIACNEPETCKEICGMEKGCFDIAYARLVVKLMPVGLRGLILSVMMSALISSLTSIFNSTATIFTIDVWSNIRKAASDVELMIVGRLVVVVLVVISVVWLPIVQEFTELFTYIQAFTSYLAPPVCAVFILAVFWKRITEMAAFWGLIFGLVIGLIRATWEVYYKVFSRPCGMEKVVEPSPLISEVHYLHFGVILWLIITIFCVILSYFTPHPKESMYMGKTFFTRFRAAVVIWPLELKQVVLEQPRLAQPRYFQEMMAGRQYEELPVFTKLCLWICGIEEMTQTRREEAPVEAEKVNRSIYEPPKQALMLHVQMVLAIIVISAIWIYYSV